MQASLKSLVSHVFGQSTRSAETQRTLCAPQPLAINLHQFVSGGTAAPRSGWSVAAPRSGWSVAAPRSGW